MAKTARRGRAKQAEAGAAALELARQQIGTTARTRARWVLGFVEKNLDALSAAEQAALGYQLWALGEQAMAPPGIAKLPEIVGLSPMPLGELRAHHRRLAEGVERTFATPSGWSVPPLTISASRIPAAEGHIRLRLTAEFDPRGKMEAGRIDLAAVQALVEVSDRLRVCADDQCAARFVAGDRRAAYCKPQHSMRVRNRGRRPKGGK